MKNIQYLVVFLVNLLLLNSCSKDDESEPCPQNENSSMKINGEEMQFYVMGRGIDSDNDGSGHTLFLNIVSGEFSPAQNSYSINIKLPYQGTGNNIIEEFFYFRVVNGASSEGDFVQGELQSRVNVNTNTCFSATFSGSAIIDGNEIILSDGFIDHIYDEPFDIQSYTATSLVQ